MIPKSAASKRYSRLASAARKPWLSVQKCGRTFDPSELLKPSGPPRMTGAEVWKLCSIADNLRLLNSTTRDSLRRAAWLIWNVGFMSVHAQFSSPAQRTLPNRFGS